MHALCRYTLSTNFVNTPCQCSHQHTPVNSCCRSILTMIPTLSFQHPLKSSTHSPPLPLISTLDSTMCDINLTIPPSSVMNQPNHQPTNQPTHQPTDQPPTSYAMLEHMSTHQGRVCVTCPEMNCTAT